MIAQMKIKQNIIQGGHIFQIIHTNALLNLIKNQPDINKIYLYAKIPMKRNINI